MPGSWELLPPKEVLVAILTRETVTAAWAKSHREMMLPPGHGIAFLAGMPFDHARNHAAHVVLEQGFQYLWFIDDDVIVPPDAYEILRSNNLDVVSGLYYRRNEPIVPVAIVKKPEGGTTWLSSWTLGQIIRVYYAGAGCMLIRRRVFEVMPPPWFEWMCDRNEAPEGERTSEDFTFCRKLEKHGFQTFLDTRVQCLHCGLSISSPDGKINPLVAR
jgi:hypothetical protein